jgi:hypothetical protein
MTNHNVKQLEKDFCEYYEGDEDDLREYVDNSDHFSDIVYWVAESLGYTNTKFSEIQESGYEDDWTESTCPSLGKNKKLVWMLDEGRSDMEYLVHAIVDAPNWVLGSDNRESKDTRMMALCIAGNSGDDHVYSDIHEVGKCPHCLYEHEIMVDEKLKVTATFYIRVKAKDRQGRIQDIIDNALDAVFYTSTIEENLYDEIYYDLDDDLVVKVVRDKIAQTSVPKTRKI